MKRARIDGSSGSVGMGPLGRCQHLGRLARVEARDRRLGEHRHRNARDRRAPPPRSGSRSRASPDRGAARCGRRADRSPTPVAGSGAHPRASSSNCAGAVDEPGVPGGLGRLEQQPRAPFAVGREPRRPLERGRRGRVRAAVAAADAGLLERRRRRLVGADRRRGQMPGPPVDVPVGQRRRERPVRVAPLIRRGAGVDRRAGQRMAKLDRARRGGSTSPALSATRERRRGRRSRRSRGALEHRQIAAVAGRHEHERVTGGVVELVDTPQERARDPRGDQDRGAFGREREVAGVGVGAARSARAGCRRSRRAGARPRQAQARRAASPPHRW